MKVFAAGDIDEAPCNLHDSHSLACPVAGGQAEGVVYGLHRWVK